MIAYHYTAPKTTRTCWCTSCKGRYKWHPNTVLRHQKQWGYHHTATSDSDDSQDPNPAKHRRTESSEDDTSSTKSDPLMVNIEEGNPADNAADTPNDPVHPEDMSDPPNHPVEQEDIGDDIDSSDDSSEAEDDATYSSNTSSSDEEVAAAAQNDPDPNDPLYPNAHLDMKTAVAVLAAWFATSTLTEKKFGDLLKIFD
ncbi:hypothetical protein Bbelb_316730 [Branchiostoma belcheri]|nr:hypothetical protein Bbelb_316730 [Branchiostoma belcheri]